MFNLTIINNLTQFSDKFLYKLSVKRYKNAKDTKYAKKQINLCCFLQENVYIRFPKRNIYSSISKFSEKLLQYRKQ